jgi:predicted RND superfamily exporter protein
MNRRLIWILMLVAAVSLLTCLWRFRVDVDVFNLLPAESRMVEGLRLYQRSFGSSRELVISLRSEEAKLTERAARSLAESLESSGLATKAIWHRRRTAKRQAGSRAVFRTPGMRPSPRGSPTRPCN